MLPYFAHTTYSQSSNTDLASPSRLLQFGFKTDNNLVGQDFAWLGSIFYFGYLFWQPFAAYFLVKFPVRWHLATVVFIWGGLLGCTAACHNFAGLAVCRFLLGCKLKLTQCT